MTPRHARLGAARMYLIAPARLRAGRLATLVAPLAQAGADIIQLRDKTLAGSPLRDEARAVAAACADTGVLCIVNDDPTLARAVGADGVHLGREDGSVDAARRLLGADAIIGRTTRGGAQLDQVFAEGADYASVSPVFATATHPTRPPVGLAAVAAAARAEPLPWFALGGLDERRVHRVAALGARRVALLRRIVDADDPAATVRSLRARLDTKPRVLTIAGSDSGGGAGIQADIKAISAAGGFPLCAVTALTAQSTVGVDAIHEAPIGFVRDQFHAVNADIGLDAVKTGMLGTAAMVEAVAELVASLDPADEVAVVVDPVLRAESGAALMDATGEEALRRALLRYATVITPNLYEAQALADSTSTDASYLAANLYQAHGCAVIVTGGHGPRPDDVLCDGDGVRRIEGVRLDRRTTHGAGCTHSATLATHLARGTLLVDAARAANAAATEAVRHGLVIGAGSGPVDVFGAR